MTLTSLIIFTAIANPTISVEVDGEGYLRFSRDSRAVYAKNTTLVVTSGKLTNSHGDPVLPTVSIPNGTQGLDVELDGTVFVINGTSRAKAGRFVIALFPEGTALSEDKGVFVATERPKLSNPGEGIAGVIRHAEALKVGKPVATKQVETKTPDLKPEVKPEIKPEVKPEVKPAVKQEAKPEGTTTRSGSWQPVTIDPRFKPENKPEIKAPRPTPNPLTIAPGTVVIQLKDTAEVEGERFTISDLANISGDINLVAKLKEIEVGVTPMLGVSRKIESSFLLGKLRMAGIRSSQYSIEQTGPVTVSRKGQPIEHAKFIASVQEAIKLAPGVTVAYKCDDEMPDYVAPAGRYTLVVEALTGINTQTVTAIVAIYLEDPKATDSGSTWGKLPGFRRLNSRTLRFQAESSPNAVQSGRPVKVVMKAGGATIEVNGTAKTSGPVGSTVSVEVRVGTPEVRTLHTGIVTSPGQIEVRIS